MSKTTNSHAAAQAANLIPQGLIDYLSHNMSWEDASLRLHRVGKNYATMALVLTQMHITMEDPAEGNIAPVIGEYIEDIDFVHELAVLR